MLQNLPEDFGKFVDTLFEFTYNKGTDIESVLRKRNYIGLVNRPGSNLVGGETPRHFYYKEKHERTKHFCR